MAITNILKKKIGDELRNWIFLGIKTGVRRAVKDYRVLMSSDRTIDAINSLKRAIDMPHRARTRIEYFITQYSQQFLVECMALAGAETLTELNAELQTLENYAQNLVTRQGQGESWDDLATDIESNIENESIKWVFPFPPGYTDIWGE